MNFKLPKEAFVNKFIAKTKFYERVSLNSKLQKEFINKIQKITWKYKIAEDTVNIPKTDKVTEIQIFEIELKEQIIPKNILKIIDKSIPYQILYIFTYKDNTAYGITLKENFAVETYYFSDWNRKIDFDFSGINLENLYQKLIEAFVDESAKKGNDFNSIISIDKEIKSLENDILSLNKKIKKEKQFNRKVDLNKVLLEKQKKLQIVKEDK